MEQIESYIDSAVQVLQKLSGLPAIALVALLCLAAGYVLRFWKAFPNNAIPLVVTILGATYALIADDRNDTPLRIWMARNVIVGLIVGFATWAFHKMILSRIETKFPVIGPMLAALDEPEVKPPSLADTVTKG